MADTIIVKLKTLKQLEDDFRADSTKWKFCGGGSTPNSEGLEIKYMDYRWYINFKMMLNLGKNITLTKKPWPKSNYTHRSPNGFYYHELWFSPIDFITKEEMEL